MVVIRTGDAPPETRKGRVRLALRDPFIEQLLSGLDDGVDIDGARAFGKRVWSERNRWSIKRRAALPPGRIARADADRALARAIAALPRAETPNSLAAYRRDGGK